MEYLGIFGLLGFMVAAHLQIEVTKIKPRILELESRLAQLESQKGN